MEGTQKEFLTNVNLKMMGTVIKKDPNLYEILFEASNKYWDESDVFSLHGEPVYVYRNPLDPEIVIGEKVLVYISKIYWDHNYPRDIEGGGRTMRVLQAQRIEPYVFDTSIVAIQMLKSPLLFICLGLCIVMALIVWRTKKPNLP